MLYIDMGVYMCYYGLTGECMRERISLYYMSDRAYNELTIMAEEYGYVRPGMLRTRGISSFINALSESEFLDTRPEHVRERHQQQIEVGHAPIWSTHYDRRTRALKLPPECMTNLLNLAMAVGIIKIDPYLKGGPSRLSPVSVIGYVLESIGLQWLTPRSIPTKVYELEQQRESALQPGTNS